MRLRGVYFAVAALVTAQAAVTGPLLASAGTPAGQSQALSASKLSPLTVVAVYGLPDPTILCASTASTAAAQGQAGGQEPIAGSNTVPATQTAVPATQGCVLPVVDQTVAPVTPQATSEIAPLLALGPLLAAAGVAGAAAAIASGNDDPDTPASPN